MQTQDQDVAGDARSQGQDYVEEALVFIGRVWRPGRRSSKGHNSGWRRTRAKRSQGPHVHLPREQRRASLVVSGVGSLDEDQDALPDGQGSRPRSCHRQEVWWRPCLGPRPCQGRQEVRRHSPRLPQAQERSVVVRQDQELQEEGLAGKTTSSARECNDKIRRREGSNSAVSQLIHSISYCV